MFLIEKPLPQAHALISWLSQFSHFLNLFPSESLILLRFLALEIWWNMFLMATCLDILSRSCSFPTSIVLYCWAFFDSSFTACTRYLCFVCPQIDPKNLCDNFANIASFLFLALIRSAISGSNQKTLTDSCIAIFMIFFLSCIR